MTHAMLQEAQAASERVNANLPAQPNYTGLTTPSRYLIGYLGELVVRDWLAEARKRFHHRVVTDGRSQKSEFVAESVFGAEWLLEVKTASQERYQRFMFPDAQRIEFDVAVAVRLALPDRAQIMGVISRRKVAVLPVSTFPPHGTPTRWKPYTEMEGASRLLELLVDREVSQ